MLVVKKFDTHPKLWNRVNVQQMVNELTGSDEDRHEKVFGEQSRLLPKLLERMNERIAEGMYQVPLRVMPEVKEEEPVKGEEYTGGAQYGDGHNVGEEEVHRGGGNVEGVCLEGKKYL